MFATVNWSRQVLIFMCAALMSLYWTGKHGLFSSIMGETPFDNEWNEAKVTVRRLVGVRYEVVDGTNQRDEKRVIIFTTRTPETGPVVGAEMWPIPRVKTPKFKKRAKPKKEDFRKKMKGKKGRGRGKEFLEPRESVANLRIFDPSLNFLKQHFMDGEGKKHPESIVEITEEDYTNRKAKEDPLQRYMGRVNAPQQSQPGVGHKTTQTQPGAGHQTAHTQNPAVSPEKAQTGTNRPHTATEL